MGQAPDIINALMPISDDLLLIGCDHSLYRLTGDPMAGGALHLLSTVTGAAYGTPYAMDERGAVYFFGSQGGVFGAGPDGSVQRISLGRVDRRLQDIDLGRYTVQMAWDFRREALFIAVIPYGQGVERVESWLWERRTGAWWPVDWRNLEHQPTCCAVFDGDLPGDRVVAFGCEDGRVRFFDETADDDDGEPVDSRVLIGPILPPDAELEGLFRGLEVVLASDQGRVGFHWYASDVPDVLGSPVASGVLRPGRNPTRPQRARGSACWVELRSHDSDRWALESMALRVAAGGLKRGCGREPAGAAGAAGPLGAVAGARSAGSAHPVRGAGAGLRWDPVRPHAPGRPDGAPRGAAGRAGGEAPGGRFGRRGAPAAERDHRRAPGRGLMRR